MRVLTNLVRNFPDQRWSKNFTGSVWRFECLFGEIAVEN
jgi:hypothetical protein